MHPGVVDHEHVAGATAVGQVAHARGATAGDRGAAVDQQPGRVPGSTGTWAIAASGRS